KSSATARCMARTRSVRKKTAPLRTQRAMSSEPSNSALICRPISAIRSSICVRLINVVCAICARIIAFDSEAIPDVSVTEIGALHGRYVRLSDRFKSIWTYHQFAAGTYKNLLDAALPYTIDFQGIYDGIKHISGMLNSSQTNEAGNALTIHDRTLDRATATILKADDRISASILRRFFEKLKRQDESIIHFLI